MRHLTKWFIIAFAGVTILFASCVDQIKFGDSFLEKPPTTNDLNQDSIFGKADYARAFLWNAYTKLYYDYASNQKEFQTYRCSFSFHHNHPSNKASHNKVLYKHSIKMHGHNQHQ